MLKIYFYFCKNLWMDNVFFYILIRLLINSNSSDIWSMNGKVGKSLKNLLNLGWILLYKMLYILIIIVIGIIELSIFKNRFLIKNG